MFLDHDLTGADLPPRTLCLTFDDGPGPDSASLGDWLADWGIRATFFVVGRHAQARPEAVLRLRERGHLVGNHTESHPPLVAFHRDGGDVVAEVAGTQAKLGHPPGVTLFRPPYGDWREPGATTSAVAAALNASGRLGHLLGPVGWDIDAQDWAFWRDGRSAEEAGAAYLASIEARTQGGIVLLHDWGDRPEFQGGNRAGALVRWLVPRLVDRGYRFVGLDEVPAVRDAAAAIR